MLIEKVKNLQNIDFSSLRCKIVGWDFSDDFSSLRCKIVGWDFEFIILKLV